MSSTVDSSWSIKELKRVIAEAGLDTTGCFEKSEIVERAQEAQRILLQKAQANAPPAAGDGSMQEVRLGTYDALVFGLKQGQRVDAVVLVLHGFGATSRDFASLAHMVPSSEPLKGKNVVFVFPQAPANGQTMGQAAWWVIDVMSWIGALQSGDEGIARLIRNRPPGLEECRSQMTDFVERTMAMVQGAHPENSIDNVPIILGGFSQGGMTAMDLALHLPEPFHAKFVMMISSAPIVVEEWAVQLKNKGKNMKALITHGTNDPVLPFAASGWAKQLLTEHGVEVAYETHGGGHELGGAGTTRALCDFIGQSIDHFKAEQAK